MSGRTPLLEKPSDDTTIEMIATSTTELSDSEGSTDGNGTVHGNDAAASCHTTSVHTLASLHPSSPAMTTKPPLAPQALSPVALRVVLRSLEFILLNGPLLVCWALVLTSLLVREVWNGPLDSLLDSYRLEYDSSDGALGTYDARDHELTYYYRRCDHRDISTHDANDLLIDPGMTQDERKAVIMTHGAVVMKEILGEDTAVELRSYLEGRHHEFHSNNLKLPWDELFWDGDNGNRLSLGLGPEDAPIVARAISEVGSNAQLKRTLEATLGPDPAVVEVSTLSTMHNAEPQGIHTDSDWFGSSVLYARTFLHSYTMFIALQDTTSKMGATTVCPGTHWCADADLEELCQCNYTDDDEDKEHHLGYCNTFEASSNGQTGLDVGVLERGDAMMFNQNIWHRGPRNFDLERKENRVMFILTFVSRRDFQRGDNRQQGWGTYYYMRHSMWGHLFSDLKNAASGGMDLLRSRIWRAYGLVAASRPGNLPWLEHWARQLGNNMDFFRESELEDFKVMLRESTNPLVRWLVLDDAALQYLFGTSKGDSDGDGDVGWNEYLGFLVESSVYQTKQMYFILAVLTALAHCIGYAVRMALGHGFGRGKSQPFETRKPARRVQPVRGISRCCAELLASHLLVLGIALVVRQYVLYQAPLFERIHKGEVFYKPIPPLPVRRVVEYEHDEETGEVVSESTHYEDVYALDLLEVKQEREQRDFRMAHPKHPYAEYYDLERDLLEGHGRSPEEEVLLRPPIQATAFPERMDVLIGSRYDARFLASMNSVLDFHPGNKDWIESMNEYMAVLAGQDPSKLSEAFLDMAVDAILSKILDFGAHPSSSLSAGASIPRRFLRQDFETGWWVVMRRDEVALETRRVLLSMAFPGSLGVSYYYWKEVLAEARFGRLRRSAMGRTWIPQTVEQRTKDLFRDSEDSGDATTMVTPMHTMAIPMNPHTIGRRLLLPSTGRNILPKSMITGKTAVSLSMHCLKSSVVPPTVLAFREHLKQLTEDVVTLKIGDHVQYSGGDVIYQATIVDIDSEEETLEIQPLRNDSDGDEDENEDKDEDEDEDEDKDEQSKPKPITRFVHVDNVQLYRPLSEGDLVWALTEDPNTGDEDEDKNEAKDEKSWKIYEVLFISPFGQADLILTPEFLTNGDDDEDSPDNNPIMMDTRDLDLKETQKTRLRQYH